MVKKSDFLSGHEQLPSKAQEMKAKSALKQALETGNWNLIGVVLPARRWTPVRVCFKKSHTEPEDHRGEQTKSVSSTFLGGLIFTSSFVSFKH